jgi:hypothetical protein
MKSLIKISGLLLIGILCFNLAWGQTAKASKKAAKAEETGRIINSMNYVFKAEHVTPFNGGGKDLTDEYDVTVSKNKIVVFLPYFGRAYSAPTMGSDGGIKLTTTHFDYKANRNKNGSWDIVIKPTEKDPWGVKDVQLLRLSVFTDGSATLQVMCLNRDSISFTGYIDEQKKEK